jgi:hypothetical protein
MAPRRPLVEACRVASIKYQTPGQNKSEISGKAREMVDQTNEPKGYKENYNYYKVNIMPGLAM